LDEVDLVLRKAEASFTSDERQFEDLEPTNRDAVCFPLRLLQLANLGQSENSIQPFSELAAAVGRTKAPYNDQM
jgi:hypothetical protein